MEKNEIEFALQVLGGKETVFYYFKDRYAVMLLSHLTALGGCSLRSIKSSPFSGLLRKEVLRELLGRTPDGVLDHSELAGVWDVPLAYVLTVGSWPIEIDRKRFQGWYAAYNQTSRPGYNLVLQLNFPGEHERAYRELMPTSKECPFECKLHPIADTRRTLAWSRIDFDLETGEALIEEVQSDWIRLAYSLSTTVERLEADDDGTMRVTRRAVMARNFDVPARARAMERYLRRTLEKHREVWAEAMLAATIEYIVGTLGLRTIYYHTYETGVKLKSIGWRKPPRSLYTQLPKRFCFAETSRPPRFLDRSARGRYREVLDKGTRWHVLDLEPGGLDAKRA